MVTVESNGPFHISKGGGKKGKGGGVQNPTKKILGR